MKLIRRRFLHLAAGAAALPAVSRIAHGETYPSRPVRLVVPLLPPVQMTSLPVCWDSGSRSGSANPS